MTKRLIQMPVCFTCLFLIAIAIMLVYNIQGQAQISGVDYVSNEVIVTFSKAYMPSESQVNLSSARVGIPELDGMFARYGPGRLSKLIPSYNELSSESGRGVERTFLFHYHGNIDAQDLVHKLLQLPYFDRVSVNETMHLELHGTKRLVPGSETAFDLQWYFDNADAGDQSDIDIGIPPLL